jgi:NTP pyrophosphatase (non-canonical NTP hydrolase)
MNATKFDILGLIGQERNRQDAKWGPQDHSGAHWLAILMEEVGEVAECVCHTEVGPVGGVAQRFDDLLELELIQVAAVCVAWVECRRRNKPAVAVPSQEGKT